MTSHMFKVLGELSNEDHKALLIELPQEMLEELSIHTDGTVDTMELLQYLIKLGKQDQKNQKSEELSLHEEIELMLNIYDSNRASDYKNRARITKTS
ncbi:MAG: hypothetical protein K0Q57_138 [Gammaproteobacteria bacterium]|nr:hypothetical protein [Gammaproteobacteria bacterium]